MKKKNKILIHGAIDSSNFGDVIFAHIFYENLKMTNKFEVDFLGKGRYSISDFNRQELNYETRVTWKEAMKYDALVYMSGGYFGDDDKSFKKSIKRYLRYFRIGLRFAKANKPIFIIGVGGGPLYGRICTSAAKKIIKKANYISVRDNYTKEYFSAFNGKKEIHLTSDTALTIDRTNIPNLDKDIRENIRKTLKDKKVLLLHLPGTKSGDEKVLKRIIPSLNNFLEKNQDYGVVICNDFINNEDLSQNACYKEIKTQYKYAYKYYSAYQLCALINYSDFVITSKLHVGIFGCSFEKCVLSIPLHSSKTQRFYDQIGESGRCVHMNDITDEILDVLFEKYKNKNVKISQDIFEKAQRNVSFLKEIDKYL